MTDGGGEAVIKHRQRQEEADVRYPIIPLCLEECRYLERIDNSSILHTG